MGDRNKQPTAVRVDSWGFERDDHRTGVPLVGLFLIGLGVALAVDQIANRAQIGTSVFFLAIGFLLLAYALARHSGLALYASIFIVAFSLSNLLSGVGLISGDGWGTLFLGIGLLALIPMRAHAGQGWGFHVVVGGLLALWGGSEVVAHYLHGSLDAWVGPILLVLLGLYLIGREVRG